jgi:hypothetical protein
VEILFVCAAFHDLGLLKKFSSEADRFEVDSANAVRQFLEHHGVPDTRIQTAWDAISLHTTPGIAQYKQLEVELLFNGVGLDVLGIGYETFPEDLRKKVVAQFPRVNFKQDMPGRFLRVLSPRRSRRKERAMRISARISSATTSGAISTSRSRIHPFRIRRSVKSRPRVDQRPGKICLQGQLSVLPFPWEQKTSMF